MFRIISLIIICAATLPVHTKTESIEPDTQDVMPSDNTPKIDSMLEAVEMDVPRVITKSTKNESVAPIKPDVKSNKHNSNISSNGLVTKRKKVRQFMRLLLIAHAANKQ